MSVRDLTVSGHLWRLHEWGSPTAPLLLLLHGFTWDGGAWEPLASVLAERFHVVAPDVPGHGGTPSEGWVGFEDVLDGLSLLLQALTEVPVTAVGYSMGGRLALGLACRHPERVASLVLVGASAGLQDASERETRQEADRAWSRLLEGEGMSRFLDRWEALPLFETMAHIEPSHRIRWRSRRETQNPRELAIALDLLGLGAQPCYLDELHEVAVPVDLVVGERDEKFRAIASDLKARLPRARTSIVLGTGHAVPFEAPARLTDLLMNHVNTEHSMVTC